jgi:hypothetical protein
MITTLGKSLVSLIIKCEEQFVIIFGYWRYSCKLLVRFPFFKLEDLLITIGKLEGLLANFYLARNLEKIGKNMCEKLNIKTKSIGEVYI